jgi:Fe-Mn family superoxide dismutase
MTFQLEPLPFKPDALAPYISEKTMSYHYGKHHQGYVDKLNKAIEGTDFQDETDLVAVIEKARDKDDQNLFNNAAQVWNHDFFWQSMAPQSSAPAKDLASAIDDAFGSLDKFKTAFKDAATSQFGCGWAWLVVGAHGLEVMSTSNANPALVRGKTPLLTCDVWEHAYYLDYQNDRGAFIDAFLKNSINWDFAEANWRQKSAA